MGAARSAAGAVDDAEDDFELDHPARPAPSKTNGAPHGPHGAPRRKQRGRYKKGAAAEELESVAHGMDWDLE